MKIDARQRAILSLVILGIVVLALLSPFVIGRDARHLSAFAEGDEHAARFRATIGSDPAAIVATPHLLDDLEEPDKTLLIILGVERRYDASEVRAILRFLDNGGNVLLADESGFGTDIAKEAGFAFATQHVLDTRNHLGDPSLVAANAEVGTSQHRVLFNKPTHLVALPQAHAHDVLATSSPAAYPDGSYVDTNGDGEIDKGDQPGPFLLAIRTQVGAGTLVLVSDTGPFMDRQLGIAEFDNAAFAEALVASLVPANGRVLIDESRHAAPALLAPWDATMRAAGRLLLGATALPVILVLFAGAALVWKLTRQTEDWSHHEYDLGHTLPLSPDIRPDAERVQRFARRRISEKYNIAIEEVQAMTAEQLVAATGDRPLAEAATGSAKTDPAYFFSTLTPPEASQ